jgi:hypothetical protein
MLLSACAAIGLGLALAPQASAQWPSMNGAYPAYTFTNPYVMSPRPVRVYGPGYTFSYPHMYLSNNPSFSPAYSYPSYYNYYVTPSYTTTYRYYYWQ